MKKYLLLLLLLPFTFFGQISLKNDSPRDLQLVARDPGDNDKGVIPIEGTYDKSGSAANYTDIRVKVYRDGASTTYDVGTETIAYSGNVGTFDFGNSIKIKSEKKNYTVKVYGVIGSAETELKRVDNVVAGDVYIIQGQSNAVAQPQEDGGVSNGQKNQYIRSYGSATEEFVKLQNLQDKWYEGVGDATRGTGGNLGQWGIKLARLLLDEYGYPIAVFNGARGGRSIAYFLEDGPIEGISGEPATLSNGKKNNNFWRLQYRLTKTDLEDHVKAIFWSQGERTNARGTGEDVFKTNVYKNYFLDLKNSWEGEFSNLEQFYIFQTRYCQGCDLPPISGPNPNTSYFGEIMQTKEAQRQLAFGNNDIQIMPTNALNVSYYDGDGWHFVYPGGYEDFATRIFELVKMDLYGESYTNDVEAPMIQSAILTNGTTLTLQTDANSLSMDSGMNTDDFILGNAGSATLTDIAVSGSDVILTLSVNPGNSATISYTAQRVDDRPPTYPPAKFIKNSKGIELVCFYKYSIEIGVSTFENEIMITQYYEGSGDDKWIEIKNISGTAIPASRYHLAYFDESKIGSITNTSPTESISIEAMEVDEVFLYKKSNSSNNPGSSHLGDATRTDTDVCIFTGNDVILISTTKNNSCYNNRHDIIGSVPMSNWGANTTFIRGDDAGPNKDFDSNEWMEFSTLEIDNADADTNLALGTQTMGTTSWGGSNWTNLPPDASRSTVLTNNYDANDGTIKVNNLTVSANLNFDKGTTRSVVVYGDLTVNGSGSFTIGDKESLVMYKNNASISGSVTKLEESTDRINVHDFTYWSSPVRTADAEIRDVFPGVATDRIFYYDQTQSVETDPDTPGYFDVWVKAPQNMNMGLGQGFAAEGTDNGIHSISFTGKPNNGDISVNVVNQNPGNDFNLIGNPYPSAIDMDKFLDANSNVDGAYFWTHYTPIIGESGDYEGGDYATYNRTGGVAAENGGALPDKNIGSAQGFFVNVSNNDDVVFTNDMRMEEANDQFFKSSKSKKKDSDNVVQIDGRIWLNLKTDQGGFNQILIGFKQGLSNREDRGYDAKKFSGSSNPVSFYSLIEKEKYVIQGLRTFTNNRRVKLGFDTNVAPRIITIGIEKTEGALSNTDIFLVDTFLKVTHNLKKSDYEFKQEVIGDFPKRFVLKFASDNSGNGDVDKPKEVRNNFKVKKGSSGMSVIANNEIKRLRVYDWYGRRLISIRPRSKDFTVNVNRIRKGALIIIEATFKNGEIIRKKTVKY